MLGLPWFYGGGRMHSGIWNTDMRWGGGFGWVIPLAIWSALWTGLTLWHAARRQQKGWFIFFLLVHTAGILEILYLIFVARAFGPASKAPPSPAKKRRRR